MRHIFVEYVSFRKKHWLKLVFIFLLVFLALSSSSLAVGCWGCKPKPQPQKYWYPDSGTFTYTGSSNLVKLNMNWSNPGDWFSKISREALEIDFSNFGRKIYGRTRLPFDGCTSRTNLPYSYSDCTTAGKTETSGNISFGFGTYQALAIVKNQPYWGTIKLRRGFDYYYFNNRSLGVSIDYNVNVGQIDADFCWNPWCLLTKLGDPKILVSQREPNIYVYQSTRKSW